jgi:tetratricopeptide (TPR) repeat protein
VTTGRAASILPIGVGRGATLPSVTHGRAAGLSSYTRHLETLADARARSSVLAYGDGYLAPYRAKSLVREGFFEEVLTEVVETPVLSARVERRVTETFHEEGLGGLYLYDGSVYEVLDAIDPYGPHRYYRAPLGQNAPPGVRVGGFHFPAAYYVRPLGDASFRYNKGYRLVLVPRDIEEDVPEDFERTLKKSHFPLVIGDMAFKEGSYVQAAIAFWDALDRKPDAVAPHFALADALVALRNYGLATELIRAGLEMSPRWADRLDRRGIYGAKDEKGFEKHFGEVKLFAQQNPRAPDAWFLYGYLLLTSGDERRRGAAEEAFRLALRLDPDDALSRRYIDLLK